ncbi:MAG TPA: arsenic resistance N-acetyltransferase ArsN2 [Ferruginibacter sp.]|nr:arsenic resistance N-acetyltransferase ArsN2 [Ferruginibacter sp.]HMP19429.1 arsenic resistance N-acetyltransferase ArsN2 [Ferruginibacter sp.]
MNTTLNKTLILKIAVSDSDRQTAIQLLQQQQLPVSDLDEDKLLYLLLDAEQPVGTAGLEIFEDCALLRSVSVLSSMQGRGYGKLITDAIEAYAKESGINCMYLLTTTAKDFFDKQGYCVIGREQAPPAVQQTAEFTGLCPASAVLMKKRI